MWAEFVVGSHPCYKGVSPVSLFLLPTQKLHFQRYATASCYYYLYFNVLLLKNLLTSCFIHVVMLSSLNRNDKN